uniref:Nipped-B protein n=1 Tax=Ditylenchus dipsaci TaxID=166011 RepID=A0A915D9T0_9BILA
MNRIKDSAIGVRKQVIRILRELFELHDNLDKESDILFCVMQRINDEESVRSCVWSFFKNVWFSPLANHTKASKSEVVKRVVSMADTASICAKNKPCTRDSGVFFGAKKLAEAIVDCVLALDLKIAEDKREELDQLRSFEDQSYHLDVDNINQDRMMAALEILSIFVRVKPELLVDNAELFLPYLAMTAVTPLEQNVLLQMITILEKIVPLIQRPSECFLEALNERLISLIRNGNRQMIAASVSCLKSVFGQAGKIKPDMCSLFMVYMNFLSKIKEQMKEDSSSVVPEDKRSFVMSSIFTLGVVCRHFDFDELLINYPDIVAKFDSPRQIKRDAELKEQNVHVFRERVFALLLFFSNIQSDQSPKAIGKQMKLKESSNANYQIGQLALIALGQLAAGCAELLTKPELRFIYLTMLSTPQEEFLSSKIQVLKNLICFLVAEEEKSLKENQMIRDQEVDQRGALKQMDLNSSGLCSSVIQVYVGAILNCYIHRDETVRMEAAQVIWRTLEQGLVHPASAIPILIAMSTDPLPSVRAKIDSLFSGIEMKHSAIVASKVIPGIHNAYRLQKLVQSKENGLTRGVRCFSSDGSMLEVSSKTLTKDVQALLSGIYNTMRTNRRQRRIFVSSLLELFSENSNDGVELNELLFVAENLAHLPYHTFDEPSFILYELDVVLSITGQNILRRFERILVAPEQVSEPAEVESDDQDEDIEDPIQEDMLQHEDQIRISKLRRNSQACFILLRLKSYLVKLYGTKGDKYDPQDAAKVNDKPVVRRKMSAFSPQDIVNQLQELQAV